MKKLLGLALLAALLPVSAKAADNVGGCGWGSKLFDGERGLWPQVFAVTTNGTSGNQTFGITSGTSGCTKDGVVRSAWKTAAFIDSNMNRLASDISRGQGESLDSLAALLGVSQDDKALFGSTLQDNFALIFPNSSVKSPEVRQAIKAALANSPELAKYSSDV